MKHTGSSSSLGEQTYREPMPHERWHQTPKWHWRYWFGYRMRKGDLDNPYDREMTWSYRTYGDHARRILEEKFNVGAEQSTQDGAQRQSSAGRNHGSGTGLRSR